MCAALWRANEGPAPVFKGTRIRVDLVADMLAPGATVDEILEGYSTLNREMLSLVPLYVHSSSQQEDANRSPWRKKKPLM